MRQVSRRAVLQYTGAGLATALLEQRLLRAAALSTRPPNILLLISDEHNASVTGCYGNGLVRTPHIDGLAARGVTFDAHYCNSPLCVPSRQSITSCKYASRVSAWSNNCMMPPETPSLPRVMTAAGYDSILIGKMHYDATCRYGFNLIGGGNNSFMNGRGKRRAADDLTPHPGMSERFHEFAEGEGASEKHDRPVTQHALEFLSKRRRNDKPFFLLCGYLAPHFPLIVPGPFVQPYRGKIPAPVIPAGHLESQSRNYQHLRVGFHMENVPAAVVQNGRELYYGLTSWVDDQIGQVLAALKNSAVADNTVVIYTSDHGENMAEHGLWWKNCMYQPAARVPLVVSWPARWAGGQRRAGVCSLVDTMRTIADIGGAHVPDDWNGSSLGPLLDNPAAPWKDMAVSEYYAHNIASGYTMFRLGQYKYVYHTAADAQHPAQRELYDLSADPGEFQNLAALPDQQTRITQMHAAMIKEIGADPDETELRCRAEYAKGYHRAGQASRKNQGGDE